MNAHLFYQQQYIDLLAMIALLGFSYGFSNFMSKANRDNPQTRYKMLAICLVSIVTIIYLVSQHYAYFLYVFNLNNIQSRIIQPTMHMLGNPVILLLITISLTIMSLGLNFVRKSLYDCGNTKLLILLAGIFAGAAILELINNWLYIQTHFIQISCGLLNVYNQSLLNYFGGYTMTPAKIVTALILLPVLTPFFYCFISLIKQLRQSKKVSI